jgi:hypothetical protein
MKSTLLIFVSALVVLLSLRFLQDSRYKLYFVFEIGSYGNETPIVRPGVFEQQILNELRKKKNIDFTVRIKSEKDYLIGISLNGSKPQSLLKIRNEMQDQFIQRHNLLLEEQKKFLKGFLKKEIDLVKQLGFNKEDFVSLQSYLGPLSYNTRVVLGKDAQPERVRLSFHIYSIMSFVFSLLISIFYILIARLFLRDV